MSLTDEQIAETFELLKLASPKQREEFLGYLSFMDFNERQQFHTISWIDNVTDGEPPKELLRAFE
jgi:hypothetical protein